ncbi:MAG: hypothetical protein K0B06_09265 [Brevefilum sp.]|nr:hypothetical protein [Brevefilum sp.]
MDIRGRFIIDPDFVIRAAEVLTAEVGRNVSELIRQVQAFKHVVKTGEVTPSGATRQKDPQTRPGFSGNGLESVDTRRSFRVNTQNWRNI